MIRNFVNEELDRFDAEMQKNFEDLRREIDALEEAANNSLRELNEFPNLVMAKLDELGLTEAEKILVLKQVAEKFRK